VPARAQMPAPHSHDGFDEIIYGLRGVTTFTVDGRRRRGRHPPRDRSRL
jgi:quercetin dioxygenase-like cupin family protein